MEKNWIQKKMEFLESSINNNNNISSKMKEREKNLIEVLKKFSTLPKKQQNKMRPLLEKTFRRHEDITRSLKIFDYYSKTHAISLDMRPK